MPAHPILISEINPNLMKEIFRCDNAPDDVAEKHRSPSPPVLLHKPSSPRTPEPQRRSVRRSSSPVSRNRIRADKSTSGSPSPQTQSPRIPSPRTIYPQAAQPAQRDAASRESRPTLTENQGSARLASSYGAAFLTGHRGSASPPLAEAASRKRRRSPFPPSTVDTNRAIRTSSPACRTKGRQVTPDSGSEKPAKRVAAPTAICNLALRQKAKK